MIDDSEMRKKINLKALFKAVTIWYLLTGCDYNLLGHLLLSFFERSGSWMVTPGQWKMFCSVISPGLKFTFKVKFLAIYSNL